MGARSVPAFRAPRLVEGEASTGRLGDDALRTDLLIEEVLVLERLDGGGVAKVLRYHVSSKRYKATQEKKRNGKNKGVIALYLSISSLSPISIPETSSFASPAASRTV